MAPVDHGLQARRIRAKLERARRLPGGLPMPMGKGELGRGEPVRLGPPLAEREVAAFEQAHGVTLPACYRTFLTQVGSGSLGSPLPPHDLLPLGNDFLSFSGRTLRRLRDPPIISSALTAQDWCELERHHQALSRTEPDDEQEAADVWLYAGLLDLASAGCAGVWCLVLSGPDCGRVVHTSMEELQPIFEPEANFLDWYEGLLDWALGRAPGQRP